MRIVSWNILDGGEGRADPLAETLLAQRPDIVALVEAEDKTVLERIARRLKMDYVQAGGNEKSAAALLSRWPIRDSINQARFRPAISKCLLEASVIVPGGSLLTLGVLHLHARAFEADEQIREREIAEALSVFAEHRSAAAPHLLLGDFNANAPGQQIDPEQVKPKTREAWHASGQQIPRRVIQSVLDAGYADTLKSVRGPAADTLASFTTKNPGQRIDYIFSYAIGPTQIRDAWIEQDRLARYASDHFPVGVEISERA